ncbi:MAG: ribosomal protein S18 acetylase RimI-like enzyme [Moritella sp.]|jgi:ribosomal protein S18 acetylase RimI-like enzyme
MTTSLIKMTEAIFTEYCQSAIPSYAKENIDAGRWKEAGAIERSREDHDRLLPEGIKTKNNHLFEIKENNNDQIVGHLWIAIDEQLNQKSAFIYDIEIYEMFRRKGLAKSVLRNAEEFVMEAGIYSIGLHVFSHNKEAKALYSGLDYKTVDENTVDNNIIDKKIVSYNMQKQLYPSHSL